MKWPQVTLAQVAPAKTAGFAFNSDELVWHLGLEHIESNTGRILAKKVAPASEAGSSTYVFDDNNVLYSKLRPYLNKVLCPSESGIATTELIPLRPKKDLLDRRFLMYYLRSRRFMQFAEQCVAGVKMPRVIMDEFWQCTIPLPLVSEQRRIVEILDLADDLRRKRAEADIKAQHILPALFHRMFGTPKANWEETTLSKYVIDAKYGTSTKCSESPCGIPILRIPNVVRGEIDIEGLKYAELPEREADSLRLEQGDILFVRTNGNRDYVGRCAVFDLSDEFAFASYLIRVRLDKEELDPWYVFAYLQTPAGKQTLSHFIRTTAGQSNLGLEGIRQIPIVKPPIQLQREFKQRLLALREVTRKNGAARDSMHRLYECLLHRAFTGDLTAKWREAHMQELLQEMETQASVLAGNEGMK